MGAGDPGLEHDLGRTQSAIASLRDLLAAPSPESGPARIELRAVPAVPAAAITGTVSAEESAAWLQGALGELHATGYPQGSMVDLAFDGAAGHPSAGCTGGFIKLTTWNVGSVPGLCLQLDPDTPCDGYIFTKH
jgi:hypothetical protein